MIIPEAIFDDSHDSQNWVAKLYFVIRKQIYIIYYSHFNLFVFLINFIYLFN